MTNRAEFPNLSQVKALSGMILLGVNLVWSLHPVWGKWLLQVVSPAQGAWLRYSSALIAYGGMAIVFSLKKSRVRRVSLVQALGDFFLVPQSPKDFLWIVALGWLTFGLTPLVQMLGLSWAQASENSLIVALEPLLVTFFSFIFLGEKLRVQQSVGLGLAVLGFGLLAQLSPTRAFSAAGLGQLFLLFSLVGEVAFTVGGQPLVQRTSVVPVFGSVLALGVLGLGLLLQLSFALGWVNSFSLFAPLSGLPLNTWGGMQSLALLGLGPLGTALGYLLYWVVLAQVSPIQVSLFLFLQPLAGVLWGAWFLSERLSFSQGLGAALILLALGVANAKRLTKTQDS
ncbi:MAG: DMT family transporter [Bdellovibrionia bacterium]